VKNIEKKSILWDIVWTILTLGLFNIWVQIRQIVDSNEIIGRQEFSFFKLALLTIITIGFYFVWHEYKMTKILMNKVYPNEPGSIEGTSLLCAALAFFGLWFLVDSYQQHLINKIIDKS